MASTSEKKDEFFRDIPDWIYPKNLRESSNDPFLILQDWLHLKTTMWNYVGIIRTETPGEAIGVESGGIPSSSSKAW
jgi:hypothetical protein